MPASIYKELPIYTILPCYRLTKRACAISQVEAKVEIGGETEATKVRKTVETWH